ncbi:olfactory receptor-like protein OLF3 [Pangasianodon hypophthalmus]|uniref:olfactory receptor-like protein OLF3 n=1 Tax=Pangasianodon hypophthalmus TaxID=310915 RepID=UPI0014812D81|nr:olfactory receptor-like protein OLF3 [Pangasianodon hypophthalmus]
MVQNVSRKNINEFVFTGFDTIEKPVAVGIVILTVYILVMLANLANICFIVIDKRLHQPMYVFICNLAIVDMLYCTCSCPTMIGILIVGYKTISYVPCILQMYGFGLGFVMEVFTISVMAFDRLIAIIKPLRYHSILTNVHSVILTFLLWILGSAAIAIVPGTVVPLPLCSSTIKYVFCDYAAVVRATCVDPNPYFDLISSFTSFLMFGTFSFICLSYLKIVIVVVKMTSKGSKKKVFHTCLSHLVVIICYYGPTFILAVLTRLGVVLSLEERNGLRAGTILGPSLVNPFIYCFRTKEIKNKILRIVSKVEPTE